MCPSFKYLPEPSEIWFAVDPPGMGDMPPEGTETGELELVRFVFSLPVPLPLDAVKTVVVVPDAPHLPADPRAWVMITLVDVDVAQGRSSALMQAMSNVVDAIEGKAPEDQEAAFDLPYSAVTVVDAVTPAGQVSGAEDGAAGGMRPQDLPPSQDAFMRCLHLLNQWFRAYRLTVDASQPEITYERLLPFVVMYTGVATTWRDETGIPHVRHPSDWTGPSLMMLEHANYQDPTWPELGENFGEHMAHWVGELQHGSPAFSWRERLLEAKTACRVSGDHASAVVHAQTAAEVLVDLVLALILWETDIDPGEAASRFNEGQVTRRVKSQLPELLGGRWSIDQPGPAATWYGSCARLRNRIVHADYRPSRLEAEAAIDSVVELSKHLFDQVAERRNDYPRTALLCLGATGLARRGLWSGAIVTFHEGSATTEPDWRAAFRGWRDAMVAARDE